MNFLKSSHLLIVPACNPLPGQGLQTAIRLPGALVVVILISPGTPVLRLTPSEMAFSTLRHKLPAGTYNGTFTWQIVVKGWSFMVETSPNPATDNVQVNLEDEAAEVKALSKEENVTLTLHDFNTAMVVKKWNFKNDRKHFNLYVGDVKKGRYILVVKKGKYQQSTQIMIE